MWFPTALKYIFQLSTVTVFMYQMYTAFSQYLSYPIMHQISETELTKIPSLNFYICSLQPFNYTAANLVGYEYQSDYLQGHAFKRTNFVSWKGTKGTCLQL